MDTLTKQKCERCTRAMAVRGQELVCLNCGMKRPASNPVQEEKPEFKAVSRSKTAQLNDLAFVLIMMIGNTTYFILTIASLIGIFVNDPISAGFSMVTFAILFASAFWAVMFLNRMSNGEHRTSSSSE